MSRQSPLVAKENMAWSHGGAESVPPLFGRLTYFRHQNCFDPFYLYHRHKNGYLGSLIRLSCVDGEFQCAIELFQK
jgi:hypothetical protein